MCAKRSPVTHFEIWMGVAIAAAVALIVLHLLGLKWGH